MTIRTWGMLFLLGMIWGGSFLFAKVAVAEIPALVLVFLRVAIACTALHVVLRATGKHFPTRVGSLVDFLIMGALNNAVPFSLLFLGQTVIGAGLASIMNATTPIFTYLVAAGLLKREPLALHRTLGVLLGFSGVLVMLSSNLAGDGHDPLWAQLSCLGAAISYALAANFARRFKDMEPTVSAAGQLTGSTLIMLPVALMAGGAWSPAEVSLFAWANVLALGLLATAFAYLIYFRLLAEAGATNASVVTLIVPASAILFGTVLLGERLEFSQILGLALLLFGLVVLDGRLFRRRT